jgi:hypothetical protein
VITFVRVTKRYPDGTVGIDDLRNVGAREVYYPEIERARSRSSRNITARCCYRLRPLAPAGTWLKLPPR